MRISMYLRFQLFAKENGSLIQLTKEQTNSLSIGGYCFVIGEKVIPFDWDAFSGGEDDCDYHREVTKKELEELKDICHEVLCNPDVAEDRLPTQPGFFFGSTDYDEWYMEDIKNTIDIITEVLETTDFEKEMVYYRSSW